MLPFLVAIAAVGLLVVGLSITLMRKGHHIQSEVGENPNMLALGLDCALKDDYTPHGCATQQMGGDCVTTNCGSCADLGGCRK